MASAVLGALQYSVAALAASVVGTVHDGTARPMACTVAAAALLSCGALAFARRSAAV